MLSILVERFQQPWLEHNSIYYLTKLGREEKEILKILHGFTDEVIHTTSLDIFFFVSCDSNLLLLGYPETKTGLQTNRKERSRRNRN